MIVKEKTEWLLGALNYKRMQTHRVVASADVASNQQLLVVLGNMRVFSTIESKALKANSTIPRSSSAS